MALARCCDAAINDPRNISRWKSAQLLRSGKLAPVENESGVVKQYLACPEASGEGESEFETFVIK